MIPKRALRVAVASRVSGIAAGLLACGLAVLVSAHPVRAADATQDFPKVVKVPESAGDHQALAKRYEEDAARYRKEVAYHGQMAEAYRKSHLDPKDVATMEKHCAKLAADADKLAADADTMAKYHRLRAKEMAGK
jgi:hypothetical protein